MQNPGAAPLPYRPAGMPIASYETYSQAQRAIDRLSDEDFPVEYLSVVGSDLRLVEQVTGRLNRGRAVAAGAASGAWFGIFVGLLVGLFAPAGSSWLAIVLSAVLFGSLFGAVMGFAGYQATGGRRDFISRSGIVANRYDVLCRGPRIDEAKAILDRLAGEPAGSGEASPT